MVKSASAVVGSKIRLTQSVYDDGEDHHPPAWLAMAGEVVEVRRICETPGALAVAHADVTDSAFVVYEGEYEVLS
jgi:hypothetical protein